MPFPRTFREVRGVDLSGATSRPRPAGRARVLFVPCVWIASDAESGSPVEAPGGAQTHCTFSPQARCVVAATRTRCRCRSKSGRIERSARSSTAAFRSRGHASHGSTRPRPPLDRPSHPAPVPNLSSERYMHRRSYGSVRHGLTPDATACAGLGCSGALLGRARAGSGASGGAATRSRSRAQPSPAIGPSSPAKFRARKRATRGVGWKRRDGRAACA